MKFNNIINEYENDLFELNKLRKYSELDSIREKIIKENTSTLDAKKDFVLGIMADHFMNPKKISSHIDTSVSASVDYTYELLSEISDLSENEVTSVNITLPI